MTHRDRRIAVEEHRRKRLPDGIAAADDDDVLPGNFHLVIFKEGDDACGGRGREMFKLSREEHLPEVIGPESVDVFLRINRTNDLGKFWLQSFGEWQLDDKPRHISVSIEFLNDLQKFLKRDALGEMFVFGTHPDFFTALHFLPNVTRTRRIVSDLHDDELRIELLHSRLQASKKRIGCLSAVEDKRRHASIIQQ